MTPRLVYWTTVAVAAAFVSLAASETAGQFGDQRNLDVYNSKRSFFERSGFGALALMPHVTSQPEAAIEYEYITLPGSGRYHLTHPDAGVPDWWFIVNHRSGSRASDVHTYVGVFIAKLLKSPQRDSLELFRNAGWLKLEDTALGEFRDDYPAWTDFFELQDSTSSQESFAQEFGDWHAIPDPDTPDESSWLERDNWFNRDRVAECFRAVGRPAGDNVYFQARLIRFQVTMELNSRQPVAWNVTLNDADAFFLKTFSPEGIDIDREYCVDKG